jgi:hypothetical protein
LVFTRVFSLTSNTEIKLTSRLSFFQCNTANATARKLADLVQSKGREHFGEAAWAELPEEDRCVLDYLCGNHTRGLPVDAFNRLFETYLNDNLGSEFAAAAAASGGRSRLEKSGTALLRSLAKLAHDGWGAYAKGDGGEFHDHLVAVAHPWAKMTIGRAELSKRQDWGPEASSKLFPFVPASSSSRTAHLCSRPTCCATRALSEKHRELRETGTARWAQAQPGGAQTRERELGSRKF